jgi:hypothetical protein
VKNRLGKRLKRYATNAINTIGLDITYMEWDL